MKHALLTTVALGFTVLTTSAQAKSPAPAARPGQVCWVELGHGTFPGDTGAEGSKLKVWHPTTSAILIRRRGGDVMIDAGYSSKVDAQMAEFDPQKRPIAEQILAGYTMRQTAPQALAEVGEPLGRIKTIIPTHAHYDHISGAEDIPAAKVLLSPPEIAFVDHESRAPDILAASNIAAFRKRIEAFRFADKPYLGFARSYDVFGDGTLVVVPLPGHTPGSVGMFFKLGSQKVFAIGDVSWTDEAIDRDLPKPPALAAFADYDPAATTREVAIVHAFHLAHPDVTILPAHDRDAWLGLFGAPGCK